jgi:hypothetical protein
MLPKKTVTENLKDIVGIPVFTHDHKTRRVIIFFEYKYFFNFFASAGI